VPVLISDKVNIWREVQAHRAGLIAPDTLEGTTHLLQGWLALNAEERTAMGIRARELFDAQFAVKAMAESLLAVIGEAGGPGAA
jgi:hypothetical protein